MEFPNVGEHCMVTHCNRLDFLPFKCHRCEGIFCKDHFRYKDHSCPKSPVDDEVTQVPLCPICNKPVPYQKGQLPDVQMEKHIESDCRETRLFKTKVYTNRCSLRGCKTKEIVPIRCNDCRQNFCLTHRHPLDHNCHSSNNNISRKTLTPNNNTSRNVQAQIEEDEALARALQNSLADVPPRSMHKSTSSSMVTESRKNCIVS